MTKQGFKRLENKAIELAMRPQGHYGFWGVQSFRQWLNHGDEGMSDICACSTCYAIRKYRLERDWYKKKQEIMKETA